VPTVSQRVNRYFWPINCVWNERTDGRQKRKTSHFIFESTKSVRINPVLEREIRQYQALTKSKTRQVLDEAYAVVKTRNG
jgi:hypothetical protein